MQKLVGGTPFIPNFTKDILGFSGFVLDSFGIYRIYRNFRDFFRIFLGFRDFRDFIENFHEFMTQEQRKEENFNMNYEFSARLLGKKWSWYPQGTGSVLGRKGTHPKGTTGHTCRLSVPCPPPPDLCQFVAILFDCC